jgi:hypothetical protein
VVSVAVKAVTPSCQNDQSSDQATRRFTAGNDTARAFTADTPGGRLAGADLLGDWSPVRLGTRLARVFDRLDHPSPQLDPSEADGLNLRANAALLSALLGRAGALAPPGSLAG